MVLKLSDSEDELLQCCDENGNPTVGHLRAGVHKDPVAIWHITTAIFVVSPEGMVLCSKRAENLSQSPGRWQMAFGGHVKYGQTPLTCAIEELEEEIGLKTPPEDLYFLDTLKNPNKKHFVWMYALLFNGKKSDLKFNDGEIVSAQWRDKLEALQEGQKNPKNWASLCYLDIQDKITQWLKTK